MRCAGAGLSFRDKRSMMSGLWGGSIGGGGENAIAVGRGVRVQGRMRKR